MKPYYQHAGITLYCGDCREILPQLPKADLVLTDPPYGIGENAHRVASRTKAWSTTDYGDFGWDSQPASREEIDAVVSAGKDSIIWGGNYFHLPPSRGWLVWDKLNSGNFADCELAWTNLQMSVRILRHRWNGMIRQSENNCPRVHPTQKPVALMKWCLGFLPDAKTMVDPFCGSGSALVAAKARGMEAVGIELHEPYAEIAAKRLSQEVFDFG